MDSAIVFTYSRPAVGRESKAFDAFTGAQSFFAQHASAGKCGEPIYFLGPSGTSLIIVPGSFGDLAELVRTDEFLELWTRAILAAPDLAYEIGLYGEGVQDAMARWVRVVGELDTELAGAGIVT